MFESKFENKFLITDLGDGYDTVMHADQILVVPMETLSDKRKQQLKDGEYEKLFAHGGEFPSIYLSEIFEMLAKSGQLDELLSACRLTRLRLDGKEMPIEGEK